MTAKRKEEHSCASTATFVVSVTTGPMDVRNGGLGQRTGRETGGATAEGQEVAPPQDSFVKSYQCVNCQRIAAESQSFKQCSGCEAVRYSGQSCQKLPWNSHRGLCQVV